MVKREVGSCVCKVTARGSVMRWPRRVLLDPGQRPGETLCSSALGMQRSGAQGCCLTSPCIQGQGGQRLALRNGGFPGLGWGSRCPAVKRKYKQKERWTFPPAASRGCCPCFLVVCLNLPLLWAGEHVHPHGFHWRPESRAFDPRAPRKRSVVKRFNVFESLLFHQVVQIFYDVHRH